MDKNKAFDDVALIEDYWHNKISEKYLSSGELTDETQIPNSQVSGHISAELQFRSVHFSS